MFVLQFDPAVSIDTDYDQPAERDTTDKQDTRVATDLSLADRNVPIAGVPLRHISRTHESLRHNADI